MSFQTRLKNLNKAPGLQMKDCGIGPKVSLKTGGTDVVISGFKLLNSFKSGSKTG